MKILTCWPSVSLLLGRAKKQMSVSAGLQQILENCATTINSESGVELEQIVTAVRDTSRHAFVLLVGSKGAGKSTFIERFFRTVLSDDIRSQCSICRIEIAKHGGDESAVTKWLENSLVAGLERAIYGDDGPDYDELQGTYFDIYSRWMRGEYKHLYMSDKTRFKIKFGEELMRQRADDPSGYACRLITRASTSRKRVPVVIFDNADHFSIEFQERVFQYARSVYEQTNSLIIVPITDKTSWNIPRQGAMQSFENEVLFLPTPDPNKVIQKRIDYLTAMAKGGNAGSKTFTFSASMSIELADVEAFCVSLNQIFANTGPISRWIGRLGNQDIRQVLALTRSVVSSPHLKMVDLVKAQITRDPLAIRAERVKRAVIRGDYFDFHALTSEFVHNVYSPPVEGGETPLVVSRILLFLRDAWVKADQPHQKYVKVTQVVDYMQGMNYPAASVTRYLAWMLDAGLALSFDPSQTDIEKVTKIQASPSGLQHLTMAIGDLVYQESMAIITPILDYSIYEKMRDLHNATSGSQAQRSYAGIRNAFCDYLMTEDARICVIPKHESYASQRRLIIQCARY